MLSDLHASRARIHSGQTSAAAKLDQAVAVARSPACAHAFVHTSFDNAHRTVRAPGIDQRPLAGLAVSVKDLFDVAGEITAAGSAVLAGDAVAARDCPAVARLRAAGATLIGRTNMTEFAFSGVGVNPHHGTPPNAFDASRIPGGSSSGAAVSVATGAAYVGLGSDTGGSIRIPAALNGIVGFKNTARLVPTDGTVPLSTTLDTVCAMTRSVRDAITVHELLAARTVTRSGAPLPAYRLAVVQTTMLDGLDAATAAAFEQALKTLRDAGARIDTIALPDIQDLGAIQAAGGFAAAESYTWHRDLLARSGDGYDPRVRTRIERGAGMKAWEYLALVQARQDWIERVGKSLAGYDAVLSPTVPIVAPTLASVAPGAERDEEFFRVNALLLRNPSVINMLDGCAISIPCQQPGERPVGLMLWHGALRDDTVLNIASQAEAALARRFNAGSAA